LKINKHTTQYGKLLFVKMLSNNPNGKLVKWKHGNPEGDEGEASNQERI
jgi:hypothetical protein